MNEYILIHTFIQTILISNSGSSNNEDFYHVGKTCIKELIKLNLSQNINSQNCFLQFYYIFVFVKIEEEEDKRYFYFKFALIFIFHKKRIFFIRSKKTQIFQRQITQKSKKILKYIQKQKLCISSIKILKIFDLRNATPATLSRAGVLFINQIDIDWEKKKRKSIKLFMLFNQKCIRIHVSNAKFKQKLVYILFYYIKKQGNFQLENFKQNNFQQFQNVINQLLLYKNNQYQFQIKQILQQSQFTNRQQYRQIQITQQFCYALTIAQISYQ
ncbi:hypothetical protein TTHERM_000749022 (macronuclear) [Tetrahymena thermophila SB210]|uniref:Uncharacterized protein n=1 Tax=Tetrahymena thermophila (strain SB210) TaxID=312017 RepID=W7X6L2_TETTS|nr:hypothetical protein TTHERM_000749022 [Tetrahymena thermophila SB210]EWS75015.1 hypothetical protein TTHERM_000749022 [Tetrahymena thermophila SB210]|eukprot:XP_012652473.1 hypothetical protein TTHERM_000749022 [Tetrahymena thermophila SB210]